MIPLGSRVEDIITGFKGVVTARTVWLYGCSRYAVESEELTEGKLVDPMFFDEQRITQIGESKLNVVPSKEHNIQLGNKVKDRITGFTGVAVGITNWSSGNVTVTIEPTMLKDGKPVDSCGFDVHRVELMEETKPPVAKENTSTTGGPQRDPRQAR